MPALVNAEGILNKDYFSGVIEHVKAARLEEAKELIAHGEMLGTGQQSTWAKSVLQSRKDRVAEIA